MTSSSLLVCMFLTQLSETDSMRTAWRPDVLWWDLCSQPSTMQLDWHSPVNRIGRSATGAPFSSQMRAGSHWAHVTDVKESGERYAACNINQHDWFGQMSSGVHTDTWGPHTLISHIMSCCDGIHAIWISLWWKKRYLDFRCKCSPQWFDDYGFHWPMLGHFFFSTNDSMYNHLFIKIWCLIHVFPSGFSTCFYVLYSVYFTGKKKGFSIWQRDFQELCGDVKSQHISPLSKEMSEKKIEETDTSFTALQIKSEASRSRQKLSLAIQLETKGSSFPNK